MAQATNYEREARIILELLANEAEKWDRVDASEIDTSALDRLCTRLHDHDGWADWREIKASVYQASHDACLRRRKVVWGPILQAVVNWGMANNVNTDHARV